MLHSQIVMDTMPPPHGCFYEEPGQIDAEVKLKNKELWNQFHELQTEMIITKSGRRMFPSLHVDITKLNPTAHYCIFLEMELAVSCRFKYSTSVGWSPAGHEEAQSPHRLYLHPDSPATGAHWMAQTLSFGRVKLTNSPAPPAGHLVLASMHRYQPKVVIARTHAPQRLGWAPSRAFRFAETQFVAVTAYQNERITRLKIDHNPFAKGFRENGKSSCKRKQARAEEEGLSDEGSPKSDVRVGKEAPGFVCCPVQPYGQFYGHMWAPVPFYYPPAKRSSNERRPEEAKPRKLTDFSIRAITGQS